MHHYKIAAGARSPAIFGVPPFRRQPVGLLQTEVLSTYAALKPRDDARMTTLPAAAVNMRFPERTAEAPRRPRCNMDVLLAAVESLRLAELNGYHSRAGKVSLPVLPTTPPRAAPGANTRVYFVVRFRKCT